MAKSIANLEHSYNSKLSPFLVQTLVSLNPPPPHHIHYPNDDVMIGAWIAALKHFPDTSQDFKSDENRSPPPVKKVVPTPYMSQPLATTIIDDKEGWHNFLGRQENFDGLFTWSSVCVHHVSAREMRKFRKMDVIRGEWK